MSKTYLDVDVLTAARQRISFTLDSFPRVYVSFSGGKDSTVMLHLVAEEARRRSRRVGVLFIDWEAQFKATVDHIREMFTEYADVLDPYWICLPLRTTNACSQIEPEWSCWEAAKRDIWVRELPPEAISEPAQMPCYTDNMTFEEFLPAFADWYSRGEPTACFVGIRADESLNRFRAVARDIERFEGRPWTTRQTDTVFNAYPIYDWKTDDVWTAFGKFQWSYNRVYNLMHQAGVPLSQMRLCEPYGDEQRRGLWLYHLLEPETWTRVAARVAGANTGALYSRESGNVMGNLKVTKPEGLTWKAYAEFLLDTMPPATSTHYKGKIAVWLRWYDQRGFPGGTIHDCMDDDTGTTDRPSWRRVCKMLLKNDCWCKTLCFSPTKTSAYAAYQALMERRREAWGLI